MSGAKDKATQVDELRMLDARRAMIVWCRQQQANRTYPPHGKEAFAGFGRYGDRYVVVARTDGKWAIVDLFAPWNAGTVAAFDTPGAAEMEAQRLACLRPGALVDS